jgi:hypothetical protein
MRAKGLERMRDGVVENKSAPTEKFGGEREKKFRVLEGTSF